jgi:3-methyladenine DNA glycosylase AlkD
LHGDRVKRTAAEIDAAWAEIDRLAQETGDEEHWRKVEATLAEKDRLAKVWMRREMGLSA